MIFGYFIPRITIKKEWNARPESLRLNLFEWNITAERLWDKARTPQNMDRTLALIFDKSETSEDINTIISPFVYL